MKYTLNTAYAKEADSGSAMIRESGAYIGIFTVAKAITANSGAKGIEFTFKSNEGQEANYLTLYTHNKDGDEIFGLKQLNSLMTCLKLREIDSANQRINAYDAATRGMMETNATVFPALMGKPVGVVLQAEEYFKRDGSVGNRMAMVRFFDAKTTQTASEILADSEPKNLDMLLATLKDKKLPPLQRQAAPMAAGTDNFADADIPF